jgi:hypothetical protein
MASPAAGNNSSSVSQILKLWYKDGGVTLSTFQNRPYWALITKKADSSETEGSTFQFAIQTNDNQSRNTVFSASQSQAWGLTGNVANGGLNALTNSAAGPQGVGAIGVTQFSVSRCFNYAYASISTVLELQTRSKKGAFDSAVTRLIQSSLNVLANDQEISMFGGNATASVISGGVTTYSTGFIGNIGTGTTVSSTSGVLQLALAADISKFSPNQELDLYYSNGGVLTKRNNTSAGTGLFVGQVNRNISQLTIVNASGTPIAINSIFTDAAVGDFICVVNDYNQGQLVGTQPLGKLAGFEAWVPFGGPVSDTNSNPFMGVNRNGNIDVVRVAGNWIDGTGVLGPTANQGRTLNIEDVILAAITQQQINSDKDLDTWALNPYQNLKLLKSNVNRVNLPGGALQTSIPSLSFKATQIETDGGLSTVIPSRYCGVNRLYGLHMPSWSYIHLGDPVEMYGQDGLDGLREPMLDAKGYRFFSFGNVVCDEPSANVTCNMAL